MKNVNKTTLFIAFSTLVLGLILGWFFFGNSTTNKVEEHDHTTISDSKTIWTCSMHPQIKSNEPGYCPICGMELIPLESDGGEIDPMAVSMSPVAMQLAQVEIMVVGNDLAQKSIRLNGKIQADERLLFTQSSHIPGRVEKLTVNFTGEFVSKNQVIAHIYSPELVTAQKELFEAKKIKDSQPALFKAAKEKLKNWKLSEKQIEEIVNSDEIIEQFPILANVSGFVTKKMINLGDYIKQGEAIYEIADFSKVWVLFDVYESEMTWIKNGASVVYTVQSLPGKTFTGTISYIDPVINPKTRVAKARIEAINTDLLLKPEMFVSGTIEAKIATNKSTLTVPKTAVMWTGKRSLVYVMQKTDQDISFKMRQVTLGPELGDRYVIEAGLQSGEEIAVNGTFSIDAAAQLAGKPSMMNLEGGVAMTGHNHGSSDNSKMENMTTIPKKVSLSDETKKTLQPIFTDYFNLKTELANDDFDKAKEAGKKLKSNLNKIDMKLFKGDAHTIWMLQSTSLKASLEHIEHLADIKSIRESFLDISNVMIAIIESFDPIKTTVYVQHCPMANTEKGADWLSKEKEILNPYFGASMLTCGEITKTIN